MRRSAASLLLVLGLVGVAVVVAVPAPAEAHALLRSSEPADGTSFDEPPRSVTITLTEEPEPSLSTIRVLDRAGAEMQRGAVEVVPGQPLALRVGVAALEEGVYTVTWQVVSRVDAHPTGGAFAFGVGVSPLQAPPPPAPEPPSTSPSILEIAGRWTMFIGLTFVVGAAWVGALAFRDPARRGLGLALAAAAVAVAGLILLAAAQGRAAGGLGGLLRTSVGRALVWRAVGISVAGVLVAAARWGPTGLRRGALLLSGAAAAVAMLVHVAAGHAAAGGRYEWASIGFQWLHFVAVGIWLGGLAALLLGIRGATDETKATAVRRFSAVAGVALGVVAGTGVARAIDEVGSWGELFSSSYGVLVLVKAGLLLGLAGLGAVNRYRNVARARRTLRGLRRVSGGELVLGVVTLAVAGALAALVPPQSVPPAIAPPAAITTSGSDFATSVRVRLEVDPALPGANRFRVEASDFDSGEPFAAELVQLRFSFLGGDVPGSALALQEEDDGDYRGVGSNLAAGGLWEVTVVVQEGDTSVEVPLRIATVCQAREIPPPPNRPLPTINLTEVPRVGSVEGYTLPLGGSRAEVHFTFIGEDGKELAVEGQPWITAWRRGDEPTILRAQALTRGHFVAVADLGEGAWRFDGAATAGEVTLSGCFQQAVTV